MPRIPASRSGRAYVLGLIALAFTAWGLYAAFNALRPRPNMHVRLAAGSSVARRFQFAETFATETRKRDLYVDVVATNGFEDSIRQVAEGKADLALVSSGLEVSQCKNLCILAGLDIAPLHILVRRDLADRGHSLVEVIKGRSVNFGQAGTNDFMLANDIVRFLRLRPKDSSGQGDFTTSLMGKEELIQTAQDIQSQQGREREASLQSMPDVIMTVGSLPGVVVQTILDTEAYALVPFRHAEPFLKSELHRVGGVEGSVDRLFVEPTTIHAGMYLGSSLTPSNDCPTVGLRTILVTRADMPATIVKRVMQGVFETDFLRRAQPQSPQKFASAYAIHPAALAYLDRDRPLLTGVFLEAISEFLTIFGAFSAGALSLYGYIRRRRIRRPGEYLEEIRKIDALASGEQEESEIQLSSEVLAKQIDARLNQLKEQVLRDYCDNRVQGEMVLLSILSTLADSRSRLHVATGRQNGSQMASQQAVPSPESPNIYRITDSISARAA
jgi:TRAP-type uncharacterized transport system substrate-binding protein